MGSFGGVLGGFAEGFQGGYRLGLASRQQDLQDYRYGRPPDDEVNAQPDMPTGGSVPNTQPGTDTGTTGSTGGSNGGFRGDEIAWKDATPEQKALLNTISGPESGGRYNIIYGGGKFDSYKDHPRQDVRIRTGPNANRTSSAAGKYQFLGSTWDNIAKKYGLTDFSPENQDKAAWYLAAETVGGEDKLNAILRSKDPAQLVALSKKLSPIWTSLPSGIEQGTTTDAFVSSYDKYLTKFAAEPTTTAATTGVKTAIAEQGGDPDSPLAEGLADLKEKDAAEPEDEGAENTAMIPIPEAPQVQLASWDKFAQPAWEEEPPTMFAAEGGAIPAPNPQAKYDAYNAMVAAGPPGMSKATGASFTPRRVGTPSPTAVAAGPTASQLAFRNLPKYQMPVQQTAAAAAPVANPEPSQLQRKIAATKNIQRPGESSNSRQSEIMRSRKIAAMQQQLRKQRGFKEGGKVTAKPKDFPQRVERERTMSSRGDEAGQGARDRAARRVTTGGRSTALGNDGYWTTPTTPRKRDTPRHRSGTDPTKTSSAPLAQPAGTPTLPYERPGYPYPAEPGQQRPNHPPNPTMGRGYRPDGTPTSEYEPGSISVGPAETSAIPDPDSMWRARDEEYKRRQQPPSGPGGVPAGRKVISPTPASAIPVPPDTAEPVQPSAFINGQEVRNPANPNSPAAPEPGVWINGQFVPMSQAQNTVGAGMFAEGGIIPEDPLVSPRAESAAYQQPQQQAAPVQRQPEDRQPTPKLLADVGTAVKGGVNFLARTFGLDGGDGAIATPESQGAVQGGARRLAMGEGAASPEEIKAIDDKIDPNRELSEGDRHMERMAKTMQWYLMNGRKEDAEGAAASLVMYGSRKFGQLGAMAGAAYKEYQKTGDPNALQDAVGYLEKAYDYIPDGGSFDVISIDPETGKLMTVKRNADGTEENIEINPDQLPALLQQVQSGSSYWQEIQRISDPEGARQDKRLAHEDTRDARQRREKLADTADTRKYEETKTGETRKYEEQQAEEKFAREREENDRKARLEQKIRREDKLVDEALLRSREPKDKSGKNIDTELVRPALGEYFAARTAYKENETPENKAAMDEAGARVFEAVDGDVDWMKKAGVTLSEDTDAGFTMPATTGGKTAKPAKYPDAKWGKDPNTGEAGWFRENPPGSSKYERVG